MGLWQKYVRKRLTNIQLLANAWASLDRANGTGVLEEKRHDELRSFMEEDLQNVHFGFKDGLRYIRKMRDECSWYRTLVELERILHEFKCQIYMDKELAPALAQYGYMPLEDPTPPPLKGSRVYFRGPNNTVESFSEDEYGIYQCEALLATLRGEDEPKLSLTEIRKRIKDSREKDCTTALDESH